MKYVMILLSMFLLSACDPISTDSNDQSISNDQSNNTIQSNANKYIPEKIDDNSYYVFKSIKSSQRVTRIEFNDAVCFISTNTSNYDTALSCIPKQNL